jgi:hypothetical protein
MARILLGRVTGLGAAALLLAALYAALALPLLLGGERLVLRDTLVTHRPLKAFGAAALAAGEVPRVNPTWALGQPFAGNPNALPFYPGNLLYLVLPFETAFHLHFVLHGLLAFLGACGLARAAGADRAGGLVAGATYAGSGYLLSTWSFYNLLAVAAWAPFVLWGILAGTRRATLAAGLACGMMLLGGEPVTAALVVPAMAAVGWSRWGFRGGLARSLAVGLLGAALAAPQLVATARVLPASVRALEGVDPTLGAAQSLHPARLLELLLPLPWGWPSDFGRFGYWSERVTPFTPYIFSLHVGVVGAALALAGAARAGVWAALAAGGLGLAWLGGVAPNLLPALSAGIFRYPQKFLFWFSLGAAVAAGLGLARVVGSRRGGRWLALAGGGLVATALALLVGFRGVTAYLAEHFATAHSIASATTHVGSWIFGFAAGGVLLLAAAWGARRGAAWALVAAQGLALAQLAPVVATDDAAVYRDPPPFRAALAGRRSLVVLPWILPEWEPGAPYPAEVQNPASVARLTFLDLEPSAGVRLGLSYPLAADLEGIYSPLQAELGRALARAGWPARVRWLRRLGVEAVVRSGPGEIAGLSPLAAETRWGVETKLLAVEAPAPPLAWPRALAVEPAPARAFAALGAGEIADDVSVVARPLAQDPDGRVGALEESADRLAFDVESAGGVALLRRAFLPFYRAWLEDGQELATLPVDLTLLGVVVPPGRHRVVVEVAHAPEQLAAAFAGVVALIALAALARTRRAPA